MAFRKLSDDWDEGKSGLEIEDIEYGMNDDKERQLVITLSNGTEIKAEPCQESWEQWGGTNKELQITMPVVEEHNDWLHGGEKPEEYRY